MANTFAFDTLTSRWLVTGRLVMETALHIGSGEEDGAVDAGVVLDRNGRPYVPGSSLKGVLRSEAERAAPALGQSACGLFSGNGVQCLTTDAAAARSVREQIRSDGLTPEVLHRIETGLCDSCRLFGSSFAASRVSVADLPLADEVTPAIERRDGVGIDRDTGTAAEHIKFDFYVVAAGATFPLRIEAENLDDGSRALLAFVLLELRAGRYAIGGKRSRGLGRCRVAELCVANVQLASKDDVLAYITGSANAPGEDASIEYLTSCVREGPRNA